MREAIFRFLTITLITILGSSAFAGNKDDDDPIFEKRFGNTGEGTQIILGFADVIAAGAMWPGADASKEALDKAHRWLRDAEGLLTDQDVARRLSSISAALGDSDEVIYHTANVLQKNFDSIPFEELAEEDIAAARHYLLEEKVRLGLSPSAVSEEFKATQIKQAQENLAKVREADLKGKLGNGIGNKVIRGVRRVGSVLFISDVLGRIYVWNVMDAQPGMAPAGTYLWHKGNDLFSWGEEKYQEYRESSPEH